MSTIQAIKGRFNWPLLVALAIGLALGAGRLYTSPPSMEGDQTNTWWPASLHVANGEGFVDCLPIYFPFCGAGNQASAMREPLPVYLFAGVAAMHGSLRTAGLVQLLLHLLVIIMVYLLAREWAGERIAGLAAGLWALYLPALVVLPQIAGDLLATLAVTTGLYCYLRAWRTGRMGHWAVAGLCMGVAVLSRSALLVTALPLGMAVVWLAYRNGWRGARLLRPVAVFASAWCLVMLPWIVRNKVVFGQLVVGSTLTGYNILRHNDQVRDKRPYHYVNEEEARPVVYAALARHTELAGDENEAQVDRIYKAEGMAVIKANKVRYAGLAAYRILPLWFNHGVNEAYGKPVGLMDRVVALQQAMLLVLALVGCWRMPRRGWPLAMAVVVLCLAYLAIVARLRYVIPVMPVVVLFAAAALGRLVAGSRKQGVQGALLAKDAERPHFKD